MPGIAVVHLVRQQNGLAPLERFLDSYRRHPAGLRHELVVVFKGFGAGAGEGYERLLAEVPHRRLFVADRGFDLRAYFAAVAHFEHRYFCFLNSFSRLLAADWLAKLHRCVETDGVGLVAATGSYQSFAGANAERARAVAGLRPGQRLRKRLQHVLGDPAPRVVAQRAAAWVLGSVGLWDPARHFPPFPNPHLRTNAFMASRATLQRIRTRPMPFKLSAFLFESGRDGLTRQVTGLGLRALLVARDGQAFESDRWHLADCYRQAKQADLLVADNQTDAYAQADAATRAELSRLAWGSHARPA